jgi:hypothetical protein
LKLGAQGTLEGWFLWEDGISLMRDSNQSQSWIFGYNDANTGRLAYRVGGSSFVTGRSTASLRGGWHHYALTKAGGNVAFYVDGVLVHAGTGAPPLVSTAPWHVMRNGPTTRYSRGRADEIAIYDRALPAATIAAHHAAR